ncbi:pentatricopeptide repeat-containing protein At1g19720-like [Arachis duranensis]|uniref:Pentatricopeptide repeat-containing protein At1g19720-like n=1 Tax=Arachis duranensis TaxID=130453 RepID=A0A9C6WJ89_ARADU|nr:pentatricopeptide repeat-containing protein At1g19720-like [Arachis duranensis]
MSFDTLNAPEYDYIYLVDVVGYLAGIESKKTLEKNNKSTNFVRFEEPRDNIGAIPNEVAFLKIYQGKIIEHLKELDTILQTGGAINVNATGPHILLQKLSNVQSPLNASFHYEAVSSLDHFHPKGIFLPSPILAILLRHCSASKSYREGKLVHLHLKLTGFKRPTTYLANHLICMYFSCGDFVSARKLFDKIEAKNLYSWKNMISGYVKLGMMKQARDVFDRMPERDFVSWNTMIVGYTRNGVFSEALRFYRELRRLCIGYNGFSFASVLIVCVKMKDFELSRQVHAQVLVVGFLTNKGDLSDTPTLLLNLIDKSFLFIVKVQIFDNPRFSSSYKVKKMTDNVDLINKLKKAHPIQINVDYTSGLLPTSKASSIIEGEKVEDQDEGKMKRFANWILDVRNGNIGSIVGDESEIKISDNLLITTTDDPLSHLSRTILEPTFESVEKVNDFVLTIFPWMEKEYLSSDTICQADENEDVQ